MFQRLIIIGNLGNKPEMRATPKGDMVTQFSMETSRKYGDKDETTWWHITVWGKQAETCAQFLTKGSKVLVEGRLSPDANGGPKVFERKDGTWGASYEVTADNVRFLSGKAEAESEIDESY